MDFMKGYNGKILKVDLTTKVVSTIPLEKDLVEKFLGGAGYATAVLFKMRSKDTDPLGPENVRCFMGGPLLGSLATCTGRLVVCAKSPYTGILGESNCGNYIAPQIKRAGFDGIMVTGASESPVYLEITNDKAEIKDATHVWGKGIVETSEILGESLGKRTKIMCIGPGGENLVKFAIIGGDSRAFGRTGMGAVMGSKKLKAIVAVGTKKVELAKPEEFRAHVLEMNKEMMEVYTHQVFSGLGTASNMNLYSMTGELPVKYWRGAEFPEEDNISGATLCEKYLKRQRHCYACPIGCGRVISLGENELGLPSGEISGPEYETIASFGSLMDNPDLEKITKANYMCNDLGVDTVSTGGTIAFLMDLVNQGKISSSDLDGIDLKFRNMEAVFQLIQKIANKEGIGELLSLGSNAVGKHFGIKKEQIATVNNSEVILHDMRATHGMAIAYGISPHYGGSHNACDMYMVSLGLSREEAGIEMVLPHENTPEMAISAANSMEYRAFYSSYGICVFANPPTADIAKTIELGTGLPFDIERIRKIGKRVLALKRLFNLKMGFTREMEYIPKILLTPLEGGTEGAVPDTNILYSEFYKYLNWNTETGKPSEDVIKELGMENYSNF
ncbi:MAG: aldehyde ferredoxin oxidoreductase family protein [Promethearchaeota archaeon]